MTPDTPFIAKILANPHDDGPRLVFADWLEEQGDPWAELIRLQCELARYEVECETSVHSEVPIHEVQVFSKCFTDQQERCGKLLDDLTGKIVARCFRAAGRQAEDREWRWADNSLVWWRRPLTFGPPSGSAVFIWKGFPERWEATTEQWLTNHAANMAAFPFWYLKINGNDRLMRATFAFEDSFSLIGQYVGTKLLTLDVPSLMPTNAFTAWTCNLLDAWGEACMKHAGKPFTFKIGQAVMSGPPHSAAERWRKYEERWLKDSNVRIISRLEARPVGEAMPSGVR